MSIDHQKLELFVRYKRRDAFHLLGTLIFLGFCAVSVFCFSTSAHAEFITKNFQWLILIDTFLWFFSVGSTRSAISNNLNDPIAQAASEDELTQKSLNRGLHHAFVSVILLQGIFALFFYFYPQAQAYLLMASLNVIVPLFVLNAVTLYLDR